MIYPVEVNAPVALGLGAVRHLMNIATPCISVRLLLPSFPLYRYLDYVCSDPDDVAQAQGVLHGPLLRLRHLQHPHQQADLLSHFRGACLDSASALERLYHYALSDLA